MHRQCERGYDSEFPLPYIFAFTLCRPVVDRANNCDKRNHYGDTLACLLCIETQA